MLNDIQVKRMLEIWSDPYLEVSDIDYDLESKGLVMILDDETLLSSRSEYILAGYNQEDTESRLRNFTGWDDIDLFVNVYKVTREYGGPEEGGWFFNWYDCVDSYRVTGYDRADSLRDKKEEEFDKKSWGNIYSVNGGVEYAVNVELEEAESETKERPYYE